MTATATPAAPPRPPDGASNGDLVRWAFAVLNTRDVSPLRGFWSDTTTVEFPHETVVGADAIAASFARSFAAMPDFRIEIVALAEQGDDVFVHWRMSGHHTGAPFTGVAASGRRVELEGMDHFVIRDGAIVSNFVAFDQMRFARAVGLLPEDGTPLDRASKAAFAAKTRLARRLGR